MKSSTVSLILASAAFFGVANAHSRVWSDWVDGVDQGAGAGVYIRQPPSNSPVKDLTSDDVFCNVDGTTAASSTIFIAAGDTLTSEWYHDTRGDDIIASSHVGPIVAYIAPADATPGEDAWVKIYEEGYDGSEWAVTKLIANEGKVDITIPSTLATGDYLYRIEILALHESDTLYTANSARGIQLYPSCHQLTVTGSGSTSLPSGVPFPGTYTDDEPGILFNVYNEDASTYVIPGPDVWDGTSSYDTSGYTDGSSGSSSSSTATAAAVVSSTTSAATVIATSASASATTAVTSTSNVIVSSSVSSAVSSSAAVSATAKSTSSVATTATTAAATATSTSGVVDANVCYNNRNTCVAKNRPSTDTTACDTEKTSCLSNAEINYNMVTRAKRDGKFGRLLI
ncbi:glycoside hydrolase family 61 protein [Desarmillaria tabescens]|uniref:AA9 family lytic polysaccharide monooxygenase n=1 Tax=Armillaria tabescens TaxID=1929756 RepID=A0AA39N300_ARMTA|nr:glycoside hydrolase family 61 protein [Desarmillaria tabescens]KAK0455494.1 glycoside hydrolase family 61 protein [Desarmillaria tabescens]